jgi:hypothetical protein
MIKSNGSDKNLNQKIDKSDMRNILGFISQKEWTKDINIDDLMKIKLMNKKDLLIPTNYEF